MADYNDPNKERAIREALQAQDVWKLRGLALEAGGLLNGTYLLYETLVEWPLAIRVEGSSLCETFCHLNNQYPFSHLYILSLHVLL